MIPMNYSIWQMIVNLCVQHIVSIEKEIRIVLNTNDETIIKNHLKVIADELDLVLSILKNTNPKEGTYGYVGSR